MGSICYINRKPKTWPILAEEIPCKIDGETLARVRYGSFDDYPEGEMEMECFIRTSVLQKLLNGSFKVSENSHWKKELIIENQYGEVIEPVAAGIIY